MPTRAKCIVCEKEFVEGDSIQAFLRSPDDEEGSWTALIQVDVDFQNRVIQNESKVKRKHELCSEDRSTDTKPDWSTPCDNCGSLPTLPCTGLCGPCTFGEADTAGGNW